MKNKNDNLMMMETFRQNPEKGFELIYRAWSGPLFRYLKNSFNLTAEEAEDLLHNVFLPWVQTPQNLLNIENPGAYLFTSARNAALKHGEKAVARPLVNEPAESSHDEHVETGILINNALNKLPDDQKEAVVLKVWTDMTFEEIADVQRCSLQTVASRYRYAIARLKELIPWAK